MVRCTNSLFPLSKREALILNIRARARITPRRRYKYVVHTSSPRLVFANGYVTCVLSCVQSAFEVRT